MYCWVVPDWWHHFWRHKWKPTDIHKFKKKESIYFVSVIIYFKDFLTISDKLSPPRPRYGFWQMHWHVPVVLLTKPFINGRDKTKIYNIFMLIYFQLAMLIILNVTSYRFVLILAWLIHIFMNIQAIKSDALIIILKFLYLLGFLNIYEMNFYCMTDPLWSNHNSLICNFWHTFSKT